MIAHDMFDKVEGEHKAGKKGHGASMPACIPCRGSKADCSHSKLLDPLEETRWARSALKSYWDGKITLSELFARRNGPAKAVAPFGTDTIPGHIDAEEDAAFEAVVKRWKDGERLPRIALRTTLSPYHREARENRATRRAEREKALAGEREVEMKKLNMIRYLAERLRLGTLSAPTYAWKDYENKISQLQKTSSERRRAGESATAFEEIAPYPDFYAAGRNGGNARLRGESTPALDVSRSSTAPLPHLNTPNELPAPLPADGTVNSPTFRPDTILSTAASKVQ